MLHMRRTENTVEDYSHYAKTKRKSRVPCITINIFLINNKLNMYSQNNEDEIIFDYFKTKYPEKSGIGTMIEIGANDGKTFSNSLLFAENGWKCTLVEPSRRAFSLLEKLHLNKPNIILHNFGFGMFNGTQTFYESGAYRDGDDVALYSSLDKDEIQKWKNDVPFVEVEADFITWVDFRNQNHEKYDFISIDCEGFDYNVLKSSKELLENNRIKMIKIEVLNTEDNFVNIVNLLNLHNLSLIGLTNLNYISGELNFFDAYFQLQK